MSIKIMPHLFLVRINKQEQKNFKDKISKDSPFFMPFGSVHNSRNMECGEIIQIGERMKGTDQWVEDSANGIYGWDGCKVGYKLIFHHTIEAPVSSKDRGQRYFIKEDENYNYYAVDLINVRGFYDGEKVTPHPNFVFLKNIPAFPPDGNIDAATGNKIQQTSGGIFMVTDWEDSANDVAQRSQKIKERIESLTKSQRTNAVQSELERLEKERQDLNRKAQQNKYLPYKVAHSNKRLDRDLGVKVSEDRILYCFNKSCLYISNFQDKEYTYIIAPVDHVGGLLN